MNASPYGGPCFKDNSYEELYYRYNKVLDTLTMAVSDDEVSIAKQAFVRADPSLGPSGKSVRAMLEAFVAHRRCRGSI